MNNALSRLRPSGFRLEGCERSRAPTGITAISGRWRVITVNLGVAVVGTVLTSRFTSGLPASLRDHADSTSQTLRAAQQLGADVRTQAVNAFTDAMATGFRVVAVIVVIAAVVVARGLSPTSPRA